MTSTIVTLENDLFVCRLMPELGGSIHSFDCKLDDAGQIQPLLRHTREGELRDVLDFASWPLVPFSNRIRHGAFVFQGKEYSIAKNYLGGPNAMHASHGQGWQFPWAVEQQSQTACALTFEYDPKTKGMEGLWPFPYRATQMFELHDNGLYIAFSVTNTGNVPMPSGLGMHPYFPKEAGTTLQAKVTGLWEINDEVIPTRNVTPPPVYDFASPKSLDEAQLDSCFSGYGGVMQVVWPTRPVALTLESSANLGHFVVYTPKGETFFCAEPISHKPNAVNDPDWTGNGLIVLAPGETQEAWYRYEAMKRAGAPARLAALTPHKPLVL